MYSHKQHENRVEIATLGGGCFWCIEAIFDEIDGVISVVSGYAGGSTQDPTYREVCNGNTGHAEVVQVSFDPAIVSYENLLRIFLTMHNPTSMNQQGADRGSQYRSVIFYHNEEQYQGVKEVIKELQPYFDKPIVTEVSPISPFLKQKNTTSSIIRKIWKKRIANRLSTPS